MLDYFDDITTDLRILAHVADWRALSGPEFFALVHRLPKFDGVLRFRLLAAFEADKERAQRAASELDAAQAVADAEADGWIERG